MGQITLIELIRRQTPGMTLEQTLYTDPSVFALDVEHIVSKQWLYVDHRSRWSKPGDYIVHEIAGESIVIILDENGELHAHFNVCRHRGSRLCSAASGNAKHLICPYHAWVYSHDGSLVNARLMGDDFDPSQYGLHRCQIQVLHGLVFINLAQPDDPRVSPFNEIQGHYEPYLALNQVESAKIAHTESFPTNANWKLVVENFRECYHCAPSHAEFTRINDYVNRTPYSITAYQSERDDWANIWSPEGRVTSMFAHATTDDRQPLGMNSRPIRKGWSTLSQDGAPLAPLMGSIESYDGGSASLHVGPLTYIYICNDHLTTFRFTPVNEAKTMVDLTWLVRADAVEGKDYDVEKLAWLWHVTTVQDTRIINDTINSAFRRHGTHQAPTHLEKRRRPLLPPGIYLDLTRR